jgi:predicted Zn-dependent protease
MFLMTITLVGGPTSCKTLGRPVADAIVPVSQERDLGKEMSAEVEKELTLLKNPAINDWIDTLGDRVVRKAANDIPKGIQFTFKVVDDPDTVNAFALPGGYIYVYTGLLKKAENEAEIVAVLGHEVAHVTQRHIAQRLTTMYGVSTLASLALGENPSQLAQIAAGIAANGFLLKYSRDHEREADSVGIRYTAAVGYTPNGYVTFFNKLAEEPQPPVFLSSHPNPRERVKNAQAAIAKMSKGLVNQPTGKKKYNEMIQKL